MVEGLQKNSLDKKKEEKTEEHSRKPNQNTNITNIKQKKRTSYTETKIKIINEILSIRCLH